MILGLDTLTPRTSVAIGTHTTTYPEIALNQAESVMDQIKIELSENGVSFADLSGVVVYTGPGSFTGLRVGLAAAHGIAQALDIPVIGVRVPESFELCVSPDTDQMLLVDSRRSDLAFAIRAEGETQFPALREAPIDEIAALVLSGGFALLGNGIVRLAPEILTSVNIKQEWIPIGDVIAAISSCNTPMPKMYKAINATPFYLRGPDITISDKKFEHQHLYKSAN